MLGIEAFSCKLFVEMGVGVTVDFNHDRVSPALILFAPERTIGYAAFYDWLWHCRNHPHIQVARLHKSVSKGTIGKFNTTLMADLQ
jgi:hypothetical protein